MHRTRIPLALAAALLAVAAPAAEAAKPTAAVAGRTLTVTGTARADVLALRSDPATAHTVDVDLGDDGTADFSFAQDTFKRIRVEAGGGPDQLRVEGVLPVPTTVDGEGGRDTLTGGAGAERLDGGDGADTVDGNGGDDTIDLGAGRDKFTWDPGDGNDSVRGGDGTDRVTFNGSNVRDKFRLVPKGDHARLTRDIDNVRIPLREVEHVVVRPLGSDDTLIVGDLTGTGVTKVIHDGSLDGGVPELGFDRTTVKGTNAADGIFVRGRDGHAKVTGLAATVELHDADQAHDTLTIKARRGEDIISARKLKRTAVKLVADGGGDADVLVGGSGDDTFLGGGAGDLIDGNAGDDAAAGDAGDDIALLGGGADRFDWGPGDGDDTVEGQSGQDALRFIGSDAAERIDVSSDGGRLRVERNIGHVVLDGNHVESVELDPRGGADRLFVHDLTKTSVRSVDADLSADQFGLEQDGAPDEVTVDGTDHKDNVFIFGSDPLLQDPSAGIQSGGPFVSIENPDGPLDRLTYRARGGADTVHADALEGDVIALQLDGGDGDDHLLGSPGDDTLFGGPGQDSLDGDGGNDTIVF
jgi:Ca2+-binding RTX toxin-like protein